MEDHIKQIQEWTRRVEDILIEVINYKDKNGKFIAVRHSKVVKEFNEMMEDFEKQYNAGD